MDAAVKLTTNGNHSVDTMRDAVGQHSMGLRTVCTGTTRGRGERLQFSGYDITAPGFTTHLGERNLCYGDDWERNDGHY